MPQVRWLAVVVAVLAAVLVPVAPAEAAPTVIDFEDASTGFLTTHYPGVTFSNVEVLQRTGGFARSGTKFAQTCDRVNGFDCFKNNPLRMDFDEGKYRIRVFVGLNLTSSPALTVELRVWSRDLSPFRPSFVLERVRHTFPASSSPTPIRQEMAITLTYNGIFAADLQILDSSNAGVAIDDLEFERGAPALAFSPDPVDFGDVPVSGGTVDRTVTVTNEGPVNASTREVFVEGADAGDFVITEEACSNRVLAPGGDCTVELRFEPSAGGSRSASLAVARVGADPPESVDLVGSRAVRGSTTTALTSTSQTTRPTFPPPTTTTIVIPPTTPGVTLSVSPVLTKPGFVAMARGTGFPEGPVELSWLPGLGAARGSAGADGTFSAQVLVFPNDVVGRRTLVATGGAATATAGFLVVPGTVKPSGKDVTHLNRARQYVNR